MKKSFKLSEEAFQMDGKMPLSQAIPLGLQHVLAMFVGNLTPLLIITGACGLAGGEFAQLQLSLLQNAMLVAGIVTLVQLFSIGPVGGKVPIIMGTSSGFIGVFNSVAASMGGGVLAYGAIMGASIIGGLFETVLGFFLKPLRKFFPAVVTGTVVMSIGLSLISVGINSFGGGNNAKDFGSVENLLLAVFVLAMILVFKHGTKGFLSSSAILFGIIAGYIAAVVMGFVLPTTGVTADGVEYTKAWVLNWNKVAEASWFEIPKLMPVKPVFDLRAILPVLIMFIVTAVLRSVIWCIAEYLLQPECGTGRYDKGSKPLCTCDRSDFPDLVRPLPEAGGAGFHHASVGTGWRGSYDVFFYRHQRYSADHEESVDCPEPFHRIGSARCRLWYGRQHRNPCKCASVYSADLRRLRYCTGCDGSDFVEYCTSERGLKNCHLYGGNFF